MSRPRFLAPLAAGLAAVCLVPRPAASQIGPAHWDADERVLVTSFQRATALARSPSQLFVATDAGLVVRDDAFGRWSLPITREDGYPASRVFAMAWDARDRTIWLATEDARLIQLDPHDRRFLDDIRLNRAVDRVLPSPDDLSALLVLQGVQWFSMDSFSRRMTPVDRRVAERAETADLDLSRRRELLRDPRFQAGRAFIAERGSRNYQVTDVMPSTQLGTFWVASYGGFLFEYDSFSGDSRPVDYGLVGKGAAAVLAEDSVVWFAPDEVDERYAITMAGSDLDSWKTWDEASIGPADRDVPRDRIRSIRRVDTDLWFGGDRGLYRFDGVEWHREGGAAFRTGADVLALASGSGDLAGLWIGTERGLYRLRAPGASVEGPWLAARRIRALASHGDRIWLATDAGLVAVDASSGGPVIGAPVSGPRGPAWALASDGERLFAGTDRAVWSLGADGWSRVGSLGAVGGPITALTAAGGVVWLGDPDGVTRWDRNSGEQRRFTFSAGDLPAGDRGETFVSDISVALPGQVWIATPAGAVRLLVD